MYYLYDNNDPKDIYARSAFTEDYLKECAKEYGITDYRIEQH